MTSIESGEFERLVEYDTFRYGEPESYRNTLWRLTGQLWNSSDIMPKSLREELGLTQGSTYSRDARVVRARLRMDDAMEAAVPFGFGSLRMNRRAGERHPDARHDERNYLKSW
jgi:hypothetical protein